MQAISTFRMQPLSLKLILACVGKAEGPAHTDFTARNLASFLGRVLRTAR